MAISVPIELGYEFEVKSPFKDVFAVLSDVPTSVSHFPKVDKLVDEGGGVYRWEMKKVGVGSIGLQTVYASKYVSDAKKGSVVWTPVKGVGNAQVGGSWKIKDNKKSTALELKISGTVDVPAPGLMKSMISPMVVSEFEGLVDQYVENLVKAFGGEA
ncbi:MAG: SRPBCC family protein [Burkholderiales bacterium]|jgi:carbon monoxide dehydrogenase subunit G